MNRNTVGPTLDPWTRSLGLKFRRLQLRSTHILCRRRAQEWDRRTSEEENEAAEVVEEVAAVAEVAAASEIAHTICLGTRVRVLRRVDHCLPEDGRNH